MKNDLFQSSYILGILPNIRLAFYRILQFIFSDKFAIIKAIKKLFFIYMPVVALMTEGAFVVCTCSIIYCPGERKTSKVWSACIRLERRKLKRRFEHEKKSMDRKFVFMRCHGGEHFWIWLFADNIRSRRHCIWRSERRWCGQ